MKKSTIFYFVSLTVSLLSYFQFFFSFFNLKISEAISDPSDVQIYVYSALIVVMIPLFVLSIWQAVKSIKAQNEISVLSIVILLANLIVMFAVSSFARIHEFVEYYNTYSGLLENEYLSQEIIDVYTVSRKRLIISLISGFLSPLTYLITSVLATVCKIKESKHAKTDDATQSLHIEP